MKFSTFTRTALAGVAALMICGSAAADTWRVATEGTFPPFEFYNSQTGEVQGFEVDLVKAMAQKMGKDLKLETLGFDAIIPGILSGTIDTGAAGFSITPEVCGMVGLALHGGAYMAESFRAGLENVEPIQRESAISLGLSKLQSMRYVVLPQAVSLSFPSFVANVIFLLKETSVFSAISLMDLMFVTKDLMGLYYKTTECLVMLVAFYLIILVPVSVAGTYIERRLRHGSFGA